jgi:hypothetical protein
LDGIFYVIQELMQGGGLGSNAHHVASGKEKFSGSTTTELEKMEKKPTASKQAATIGMISICDLYPSFLYLHGDRNHFERHPAHAPKAMHFSGMLSLPEPIRVQSILSNACNNKYDLQ